MMIFFLYLFIIFFCLFILALSDVILTVQVHHLYIRLRISFFHRFKGFKSRIIITYRKQSINILHAGISIQRLNINCRHNGFQSLIRFISLFISRSKSRKDFYVVSFNLTGLSEAFLGIIKVKLIEINLTECIEQLRVIRMNLNRLLYDSCRLFRLLTVNQQVTEIFNCFRPVRTSSQGRFITSDCIRIISQLSIGSGKIVIQNRMVRVDLKTALKGRNSLIKLICFVINRAKMVVSQNVTGIHGNDIFKSINRILVIFHFLKSKAKIIVNSLLIFSGFQSLHQNCNGILIAAKPAVNSAKGSHGFNVIWMEIMNLFKIRDCLFIITSGNVNLS